MHIICSVKFESRPDAIRHKTRSLHLAHNIHCLHWYIATSVAFGTHYVPVSDLSEREEEEFKSKKA